MTQIQNAGRPMVKSYRFSFMGTEEIRKEESLRGVLAAVIRHPARFRIPSYCEIDYSADELAVVKSFRELILESME